jgi:protein-L-isoaspartate O-methyltransferase
VAVVGTDEPWVPAALESLGYDVTTDHGLRTAHHEGAFDAVLLFGARDLEERVRTLRELTRPGGRLVVSVDEPHRAAIEKLLRDEERTEITEIGGGTTLMTATKRSR